MATKVYEIISDTTLTYAQQMKALANLAENEDSTSLPRTKEELQALEDHILCDLGEGLVPFRPRYIIPDYNKVVKEGCKFLGLEPSTDIWEACNNLLIFYKHVPSITTFPVFLGNLDELLEPYVLQVSPTEAKKALKLFLLNIDKTLTDSFVHADIGPKATLTGRLILELTEEMQLAMPNLTLKYDPEVTDDEFAALCAKCMMKTSKPSFANHQMFCKEWGEDYAIASCYNGLKIAGGGYTLPRLRFYEMSLKAKDINDFLENVLPYYTNLILNFMDKRIKFIVEESSFFKSNFLVTEGFVKQENFTGMVGMVGLAECCNHLLGLKDANNGYGMNEDANNLGVKILEVFSNIVDNHIGFYSESTNNCYRLHAQVGIDSDGRENSPGCRIPVGNEPELLNHILHSTNYHKFFPTGIGDIFKLDQTWEQHPEALVDIIKGAISSGMRYFSAYLATCDVVRVTGYLVKKSELAKLDKGEQSINFSSIFGKGARDSGDALNRRTENYGREQSNNKQNH